MAINYELQDGVATFTIDNGRLNLLTMAMHEELHNYYLQFLHDDSAKVGVLAGAGENFCAGDDLREVEVCVASGPGQKGCAVWRAGD